MSADDAAGPGAGPGGGTGGPGAEPGPGPDLARAALEQARAARRSAPPGDAERVDAASRRAAARRDRPRRPKGDPVSFGDAITQLLKARGWQADAEVHSVLARWDEIVGPEIAARARPASLRDGELTLVAESTAWATQLRLLAGTVRQKVNAELGGDVVTSVRVHGPTSSRPSGGWRVRGGQGPRDTYG